MKHHLRAVIATVVLGAVLAGCGGGSEPGGTTTPTGDGASSTTGTGSSGAETTSTATTDRGNPGSGSTTAPDRSGGDASPGPRSRTRQVAELPGGRRVEYSLVLPSDYRAGRRFPVLLAFPPGSQGRSEVDALLDTWWAPEALRRGWIVVSPVAPGAPFFGESASLVPAFLDQIARQYPPEGGRFHVAGVSNGGLSAFRVALDTPSRFSSVLVAPGFPPAPDDVDKLGRLRKIPVAMYVGGEDAGWREPSVRTAARLRALKGSVQLTVSPGEGHVLRKISGARLYDWLDGTR